LKLFFVSTHFFYIVGAEIRSCSMIAEFFLSSHGFSSVGSRISGRVPPKYAGSLITGGSFVKAVTLR